MASASEDYSIRIWNTTTGETIQILTGHNDIVYSLAVLPNGLLVSGSSDTSIRIWNTKNEKQIKILNNHSKCIRSLLTLSDGSLASGSFKEIKIWNNVKLN